MSQAKRWEVNITPEGEAWKSWCNEHVFVAYAELDVESGMLTLRMPAVCVTCGCPMASARNIRLRFEGQAAPEPQA